MKQILLFKEFGNNIFTRSSMANFFINLNKSKDSKIKLDFKDIKFISRSCADEYVKKKRTSKKKIVEAHMSRDVLNMFKTVENQYEESEASFSFEVRPNASEEVIAILS